MWVIAVGAASVAVPREYGGSRGAGIASTATGRSLYRSPALRSRGSGSPRADSSTVDVGLLIPMHGPAGIFGLSCMACAVLAGEEINSADGLLGREVRLLPIDATGRPDEVADRVADLVRRGEIDAVAGWHLSHVRHALTARLRGAVPYVYGALYEGGERHPGVFMAGETPERQVAPAMAWLSHELGVRRWAVVGDDYVWPRGSAQAVHDFAAELGLEITDEMFVPLGQQDFARVLHRLRRSRAQGVLMFLVGQDAVNFNRAFAEFGLDSRMVRLSSLMDENMLLASGADATRRLYSAAGYFGTLANADALDLLGRYVTRFGPEAPVLNSMGESCYESLQLMAALVRRAGSLGVPKLMAAAESPIGYEGPRGSVHLERRHLTQRVYLARADGTDFDVVTQL